METEKENTDDGLGDGQPDKICTLEEYFFICRLNANYNVCFDYDEAGNVAIWYMAPKI